MNNSQSMSLVSASPQQSANVPRRRLYPSLPHVHETHLVQYALAWALSYVLPSYQYLAFQAAQPYCLCTPHHLAYHSPSHSHGQQHPSSRFRQVSTSNACPQCQRQPKLPDHRFCSVACGQTAALSAPELKYLLPHHVLSINVATQFLQCWKSTPRPKVLAVYMITWTQSSERSFQEYRGAVEARGQFKRRGYFPGNEQKRFRGTVRACTLGEQGNHSPCHDEACWMCETITLGWEPHLRRKRNTPLGAGGIRLGAGIYTSSSSSKADIYANNAHDPDSRIKAMFVCRIVIGRPYVKYYEDPTIRSPPAGYDCVLGKTGYAFRDDEYVVYDADAIRPAYLLLYETERDA